jgi:acetylornithine deacetylase/succinyl-diaminopimelate desuccinylase-like protein
LSLKDTFMETVESLRGELVHLARELIRILSENPPGDESLLSELASKRLRSLGIQVELVVPKPKRVNTLGTLRGTGGGRNLLYNGHYDTVDRSIENY